MLSYTSPTFVYLIAGGTKFSTSVLLVFLLSVFSIMDVWVTPIPFRLLYILPAVTMNLILTSLASKFKRTCPVNSTSVPQIFSQPYLLLFVTLLAVGFAGAQVRSGMILTVVGSVTMAVGYILHVYSRGIYLWIHRERVLMEQKDTPIAGDEAA